MKSNEPKAMKEIHEIRQKIYENTKNLKSSERTKKANESMMRMAEKYGLIIKAKT